MSFEPLETEYGKIRKRSDHRLRQFSPDEREKKEKKRPMEGYEAAEEELREKKEPREQVVFKGKRNRFSAGYNREGKLTMVFSRDKHDGDTREEELFQRERSGTWKDNKKYFRSSTGRPEKGAMALEDREGRQKKFLMKQASDAARPEKQNLLQREFSFLNTEGEHAQIHELEEDARKHSLERERVETDRSQAAMLRQDLAHKEEEKRDFLKKMASQVTAEKAQKKQKNHGTLPRQLFHDIQSQEEETSGENENGAEGKERGREKPAEQTREKAAEETAGGQPDQAE